MLVSIPLLQKRCRDDDEGKQVYSCCLSDEQLQAMHHRTKTGLHSFGRRVSGHPSFYIQCRGGLLFLSIESKAL